MSAENIDSKLPSELTQILTEFDESIQNVEKGFEPLFDTSILELKEKLSPLDQAKLDLTGVYAINSLFFMYMNAKGVSPREHNIRVELRRIQQYMARVKQIQDKANAPKLDKGAANRFVKNALWAAAHKESQPEEGAAGSADDNKGSAPSTPTSNIQPKQAKRKSAEEIVKSCFEPSKKKKKKKGKGFI